MHFLHGLSQIYMDANPCDGAAHVRDRSFENEVIFDDGLMIRQAYTITSSQLLIIYWYGQLVGHQP